MLASGASARHIRHGFWRRVGAWLWKAAAVILGSQHHTPSKRRTVTKALGTRTAMTLRTMQIRQSGTPAASREGADAKIRERIAGASVEHPSRFRMPSTKRLQFYRSSGCLPLALAVRESTIHPLMSENDFSEPSTPASGFTTSSIPTPLVPCWLFRILLACLYPPRTPGDHTHQPKAPDGSEPPIVSALSKCHSSRRTSAIGHCGSRFFVKRRVVVGNVSKYLPQRPNGTRDSKSFRSNG